MQKPDESNKRNAERWLVLAAAIVGVAAWFLFGQEPETRATTRSEPAASLSTSEVKSRAPEPLVTAVPEVPAKSPPPPPAAVESPPVMTASAAKSPGPSGEEKRVGHGAVEACPRTKPADGQPCNVGKGAAVTCAYGDEEPQTICVCGSHDTRGRWKCPSSPDPALEMPKCEESMPAQGTRCASKGLKCQYGDWPQDMTCTCKGSDSLQWSCDRREH